MPRTSVVVTQRMPAARGSSVLMARWSGKALTVAEPPPIEIVQPLT